MLFQAVGKYFADRGQVSRSLENNALHQLGREERETAPADFSREYFRINTEVLIRYWHLESPSVSSLARLQQVNLSGGGIRFQASVPLSMKQPVGLEITLPGPEPIVVRCTGRVVRFDEDAGGRRQAAVGFTVIASRDRERIIAHCFAAQRRALRRRVRVDG